MYTRISVSHTGAHVVHRDSPPSTKNNTKQALLHASLVHAPHWNFQKKVCVCVCVVIPVSSSCRLLMDYPFIKQVSDDYCAHISSLTGRDLERQISANTVRILLLEEQNTELREKNIIPKTQSSEGPPYQVCVVESSGAHEMSWLMRGVSLFQRMFSTLLYVAGIMGSVLIREVSLIRSSLIESFHCNPLFNGHLMGENRVGR